MSNLGNQASQCSLDKVADALPPALKKSVLQSLNFSTYVWVIQNKDDANKIVKVLRDNGFSNISLDDKGTTITAQSSAGQQSAGNDCSSTATSQPSCSLPTQSECESSYNEYSCCTCSWNNNSKSCGEDCSSTDCSCSSSSNGSSGSSGSSE